MKIEVTVYRNRPAIQITSETPADEEVLLYFQKCGADVRLVSSEVSQTGTGILLRRSIMIANAELKT